MDKGTSLTVQDATYDLLRRLGLTTIIGNIGSTELTFLNNFPADFRFILALQEASAVAMADGYAQATGKPALINLHTFPGTGNGMGNIAAAYMNKTPLIILSGNQTRDMLIGDVFLSNVEETVLPKPWVKWSYQPVRAEDVPAAIMRAYAAALQPPAGPVFLSVPFDDWFKPALGSAVARTVSTRIAPDPERAQQFAEKIGSARNPVLIYGPGVGKTGAWDAGVRFAEKLQAPVLFSPFTESISFPVTHPQFQGSLPPAISLVCDRLRGFDVAVVIGAQIFRYYPYIARSYLPDGTELLQITADPDEAETAFVGDSMLADPQLALETLLALIPQRSQREWPRLQHAPFEASSDGALLYASEVFSVLAESRPADAILITETESNVTALQRIWPITAPASYYSNAGGGLGWGAPAAVGIALALKTQDVKRPVVAVIGDGAFQYSIQCLYTAAQNKLPVVFIVMQNGEYGVLKDFALVEDSPNVTLSALDLPGLDIPSMAKGFGCQGVEAKTKAEIKEAFVAALVADAPTVITVPIQAQRQTHW